jgi:hypothetical protein
VYLASKDSQMKKTGTAHHTQNITITITQKPEIIRRLESAKARMWIWLHTKTNFHL